MKDTDLETHYQEYINKQMSNDAIISVSGFKKFLMISKSLKISEVLLDPS